MRVLIISNCKESNLNLQSLINVILINIKPTLNVKVIQIKSQKEAIKKKMIRIHQRDSKFKGQEWYDIHINQGTAKKKD